MEKIKDFAKLDESYKSLMRKEKESKKELNCFFWEGGKKLYYQILEVSTISEITCGVYLKLLKWVLFIWLI